MLYQTRNQLESYAKLLESSNRSLMDVTEESIEEEDDDGSIMGVMERTLTESRFPNTESDEGNSTFEASIVVRPLENEDIDEVGPNQLLDDRLLTF